MSEDDDRRDDPIYPTTGRDWINIPDMSRWAKAWTAIFTVLFVLPFVPIHGFTHTRNEYIAGPFGLPTFIWGIYALGLISCVALVVFYLQGSRRGFINTDVVDDDVTTSASEGA